jgi:hypothetical protein
MNTKYNLRALGENIVYVKTIPVADLPDGLREQAGDLVEIFAVHNTKGEQIALVADRNMAFVLARQHDMSPVAVH